MIGILEYVNYTKAGLGITFAITNGSSPRPEDMDVEKLVNFVYRNKYQNLLILRIFSFKFKQIF